MSGLGHEYGDITKCSNQTAVLEKGCIPLQTVMHVVLIQKDEQSGSLSSKNRKRTTAMDGRGIIPVLATNSTSVR